METLGSGDYFFWSKLRSLYMLVGGGKDTITAGNENQFERKNKRKY